MARRRKSNKHSPSENATVPPSPLEHNVQKKRKIQNRDSQGCETDKCDIWDKNSSKAPLKKMKTSHNPVKMPNDNSTPLKSKDIYALQDLPPSPTVPPKPVTVIPPKITQNSNLTVTSDIAEKKEICQKTEADECKKNDQKQDVFLKYQENMKEFNSIFSSMKQQDSTDSEEEENLAINRLVTSETGKNSDQYVALDHDADTETSDDELTKKLLEFEKINNHSLKSDKPESKHLSKALKWKERGNELRKQQKERWASIERNKAIKAEEMEVAQAEKAVPTEDPESKMRKIVTKDTPLYERPSYDPNWTFKQSLRTHGKYNQDECINLLSKCNCPKKHYAVKKRPEWPPSPPPFDRFGEVPYSEELTWDEMYDILVVHRTYYKGYMGYYRAKYGPDKWRDYFKMAFPTSIPQSPISDDDYVTTASESGESLPSSYDEDHPSDHDLDPNVKYKSYVKDLQWHTYKDAQRADRAAKQRKRNDRLRQQQLAKLINLRQSLQVKHDSLRIEMLEDLLSKKKSYDEVMAALYPTNSKQQESLAFQ